MNIFEHHLAEIKTVILTEKEILKLDHVDNLNGVNLEVPPEKFNFDLSCNIAMVLGKKNIKIYKIKNLNDIYKTKNQLVSFSVKMKEFDKQIKNFLRKRMYFHRMVNSKTNYGRKVIIKLFSKIKKNPKRYINIKKYNNSNTERVICDYIAGMTDRYAINLYNQIK